MTDQVGAHGGKEIRAVWPEFSAWDRLSGLLAHAPKRWFQKKLDQIDAGLLFGTLESHLPDGSFRLLGGRGEGPRAVVHLHSWAALVRLALGGSIGWYRAWEDGLWSSDNPVLLFDLFMRNSRSLGDEGRAKGWARWAAKMRHHMRRNDRRGSKANIHAHYDIGNDFYKCWLDENWNYSSALFNDLDISLEEAQLAKNDAVLGRLKLFSGADLLEIGCGWGALAERALQRYDVNYTGITLSTEQKSFAEQRLSALGPTAISQIKLTDYRDMVGQFDAIVSIEMVEAVGLEYWPEYVEAIARLLRKGGRAAIQYISIDDALFESYAASSDFIQAYIFPGGCLMSTRQFHTLCDAAGLEWTDQKDFGLDYARTLKMWRTRFDLAIIDGRLPQKFDQRFINLWRYYLQYCEGGFRGGGINVSQVTLVKR